MNDSLFLNKSEKKLFKLEVRFQNQTATSIEVIDRLIAGIDPRNDLVLIDPKVKTKHFLFRLKNNNLTVHNLGDDGDSFLNGLALEKDKLYILEKDDLLKVGKIEISIRSDCDYHFFNNSSIVSHSKNDPLTKKEDFGNYLINQVIEDKQPDGKKKSKEIPLSSVKRGALLPYKIYGFIIDFVFTYFILSFIVPYIGKVELVQDFLYPISKYLLQINPSKITRLIAPNISLIEFFITFHIVMITAALILGSTPGNFLIGIGHKGKNNFLAIRFKAYLYALLNCLALPLLIFDIPLYRGRNLKEILTFTEMELSSSLISKILRKAIMPVLLLACLFSPFFLKHPINSTLTLETLQKEKYLDLHTIPISSFSAELGLGLQTELNKDYALLPYFEKNKWGIILYDKNTNLSLIMKEVSRIQNDQSFFRFRYANPFASYLPMKKEHENQDLKNKSLLSLELSVINLSGVLKNFGPFFGNGLLFKRDLLEHFNNDNYFFYNSFGEKNPVLTLSDSSKGLSSDEKVLIFTPNETIEFTLEIKKQANLRKIFITSVLTPLRFAQPSLQKGSTNPQLLEVLDAFERSDYQTLLTYYINEVKKVQESNNPAWQAFLKKNLTETKIALFVEGTHPGATKSEENSFDEIINKL